MSKIDLQPEGSEPASPSSGFIRIYVEGTTVKYKESNGTVHTLSEGVSAEEVQDIVGAMVTDSTNIEWTYNDGANTLSADVSTNVMLKSLVSAKGDIIAGTGSSTVSALSVGPNGYRLTTDSGEASGLKWVRPQHNEYPYVIKTANYTADLDSDTVVLGIPSGSPITITMPETSGFNNNGLAREYAVANFGNDIVHIALSGSDAFVDGPSGIDLQPSEIVRFGAGYPTVGPYWFILSKTKSIIQVRKNNNWGAGSFTTDTAVPFNTVDYLNDEHRLEHDGTNNERVNILSSGPKKISFVAAIDSTGGQSYMVDFYLRKNGTTTIPGSEGSVGNYQTEDSHFSRNVVHNFTANDYVELIFDQNNLTGNAHDIVMIVEEV